MDEGLSLAFAPSYESAGGHKHAVQPGTGTGGVRMGTTHAGNATADLTATPKLLAAAPIVAVSDELTRHVGDLARLAPTSDATTALTLYRDKLAAALKRARELELFVSADVASLVLGKSISGVTYLCRTGALRAKKVGGTWQIDRLDLERLRSAHSALTATGAAPRAD